MKKKKKKKKETLWRTYDPLVEVWDNEYDERWNDF